MQYYNIKPMKFSENNFIFIIFSTIMFIKGRITRVVITVYKNDTDDKN